MSKKFFYDITVIGGGLAGICASIAASRCGVKVALIHDRPLLGGNASGEFRIHTAGADCSGNAIARYVRESGIIDEIRLENLHKNPAGSADIFSLILRNHVLSESNIDLFMNTRARKVRMKDKHTIQAVEADQVTTEKEYLFQADIFIDCTGDGYIGALAGANFRMGREAGIEFNESEAPIKADNKTLPSCVEFYLKDMGGPVEFKPPEWAYRYETPDDLPYRDVGHESWQFAGLNGGFWWLSAGGDKQIITDSEDIYEELIKVLMGVWDLIKNRMNHHADNYALDWISPVPGRRESRRFEGEHWLTQNDVLDGKIFKDRVAYGGWSIDIHPPEGIFSSQPPNIAIPLKRPYSIPLRCLYSKNISNLMFAGRDASYTHIGLGSPRVMATCAVTGQAAGAAAAVAVSRKKTPRQVKHDNLSEIQEILLKQGAYIPHCSLNDHDDLAKQAVLSASSEAELKIPDDETYENESPKSIEQNFSFEHSLFQLFPVSGNRIDFVEILISSDRQVCLKASIGRAEDIWDFSSIKNQGGQIAAVSTETTGSGLQWVRFPFKLNNISPGFFLIKIEVVNNPGSARWMGSLNSPVGVVRGRLEAPPCARGNLAPDYQTMRGTFIFRLSPESKPYSAKNVTNGVARPERWTNLWVSDAFSGKPEWIELAWDKEILIRQVNISFDGQFDSNVTWPPPLGVFGCRTLPAVVKRYSISAANKGKWKTIQKIENNYQYSRCHIFTHTKADKFKITIYETNGAPEARIFVVRVYS